MPGSVEHRSVTPIIKWLQAVLRGRPSKEHLRYADELAARTQPPPQIPGGPYHRTSKIYYYMRDARREVEPPVDVPISKLIGPGSEAAKEVKLLTPGKPHHWD